MAILSLLVLAALLSGHSAHAAAPRRALLGRPAASSLTASAPVLDDPTTPHQEINSIATLEHAVGADSKEARSKWVSAYVKPGVRTVQSAVQRIHKALGLAQERVVKGRMLQQRGTFSAAGAAGGSARSAAGTMQEPHVESVRPSGSSLSSTSSTEPLRSTTPSEYQPLGQQPQAGTASADVATAGVTGTSSNLQTTGGTQPLPQGTAQTENVRDVTPSQYGGTIGSQPQGAIAHTDVVGPATVVPDVRTGSAITGTTEMAAMRDVTPSGQAQSVNSGNQARVHADVVGQPVVVRTPTTPATSGGAASDSEATGG